MIRALAGRMLIVLSIIVSILSTQYGPSGWVAAGLAGVGLLLCCTAQRAVWHDGWHAAHEHHNIEDGHRHLDDYVNFLARQGF